MKYEMHERIILVSSSTNILAEQAKAVWQYSNATSSKPVSSNLITTGNLYDVTEVQTAGQQKVNINQHKDSSTKGGISFSDI